MRLLVYLIIAVSFMFGQIVAASPREDAEYIAEHMMMSENRRAQRLQTITHFHVLYLTRELNKHSVKVVDAKRFAEMLPVNMLESWLMRWQELHVNRLLEIHTPAKLAQIANATRVLVEESGTSQIAYPRGYGKLLGFGPPFPGPIYATSITIHDKIKQSLPQLNEAPYLADILEIDGIFFFPNRIWRKDLIAKIRGGD